LGLFQRFSPIPGCLIKSLREGKKTTLLKTKQHTFAITNYTLPSEDK